MNPFDHPLVHEMLAALERDLKRAVDLRDAETYGELGAMIQDHMGWAEADSARGKRLRPLLCMLCCSGTGSNWGRVLPLASALELVHNFSLIHDDIEDQSHTRRGRPTLWARWGIAQALNTGDAMFVLARLATHRLLEQGIRPQLTLEVMRRLDRACLQLTQGQHLDLAFEKQSAVSVQAYLSMINGKTTALLQAATALGALVGGAPDIEPFERFGSHLGFAFQILDDILGIWGEPARTGKPAGEDLLMRKKTLPVIVGLRRSARFAQLWQRGSDSREGIQPMLDALEEAAVREESLRMAGEHTDLALQALEQAAPLEPAGAILHQISHFLLYRQT